MNFLHRTWAEIDLAALKHNFGVIKKFAEGAKIMAIVKANAYGHSANELAPVLEAEGVDFFGVSNIDEAISLRAVGIKKPILILGYTPVEMAGILAENNISQCVYSPEYALGLSNEAVKANTTVKIHIKLDTGMSRLGFDCRNDKLNGIAEALNACKMPNFITEGIFTHFCESDRSLSDDDGWTDGQYSRFKKGIEFLEANGIGFEIKHCSNSAAVLLDGDKKESLVRPGIILYGLLPSDAPEFTRELIPVMTFKSVVTMVKTVAAGDTVSYGRTFKAEKEMRIATVAAGYADGYPRKLSNKAYVIINGQKAPVVGRVCMDQLSVDISHIDNVSMGDEVILFGKELPVEELAQVCDTINYELVCSISPRVPRIILK